MDQRTYQDELHSALNALGQISDRAEIRGDGAAQFVAAVRGARGVELYRDADRVLIDRSTDGELLGEQAFGSLAAALHAAKAWLSGLV